MDLCRQPLWQEQSLGTPLPCSAEGISVSLPLWRHVIGYEEKDPEVIGKFRSGYPRFCVPPVISAVFRLAIGECASQGESALVFPSMGAALRCVDFMQKRGHIAQARSGNKTLAFVSFLSLDRTVRAGFGVLPERFSAPDKRSSCFVLRANRPLSKYRRQRRLLESKGVWRSGQVRQQRMFSCFPLAWRLTTRCIEPWCR